MSTFLAAQSVEMSGMFHHPWIRPGAVSAVETGPGGKTHIVVDNPFGDDVRLDGDFMVVEGHVEGGVVTAITRIEPANDLFGTPEEVVATLDLAEPLDLAAALNQLSIKNGPAALFSGDDVIKGSREPDRLHGGGGADTLMGGGSQDVLNGGAGADVLRGGRDGDRFEYDAASNSLVGAPDLILDFHRQDGDRIDLFRIDADPNAFGEQAFTVVDAFTGAAGELTITRLPSVFRVEGDIDGDAVADFQILVMAGGSLDASDFVL